MGGDDDVITSRRRRDLDLVVVKAVDQIGLSWKKTAV